MTLYISPQGTVGFQGAVGANAWATLQRVDTDQRLSIHADADLPTPKLANVLAGLAEICIQSVDLAVGKP